MIPTCPALIRPAVSAALLLCLAACATVGEDPVPADLVLVADSIYTGLEQPRTVGAVAVRDGRIVATGSAEDMAGYRGDATRWLELTGATVLPGLTDAHRHLAGVGERALKLNLQGIDRRSAFLERVGQVAADTPPGEWIIGRGWIETHWQPPEFPTRAELDRVAPDHPVFLVRADGHAAVANSAALAAAGVDAGTADPAGGRISRDETGRPDGMLIDAAMALVDEVVPEDDTPLGELLRAGADESVRRGWTQAHVAGNRINAVRELQTLYQAGALDLRVYNAIDAPSADADLLVSNGPILDEAGGRLTVRAIKVYADGALGSRGAALLAPYADADTEGLLMIEEAELLELYTRALRAGIQVWTHAIGDRANRVVLDLYERVFERVPPAERAVAEPRWRIEHAQIIHPDDLPRFESLGVIPSMQPSHAIGDLHFAPRRLGMARLDRAYPWKRLLETGAIIPAGSDAPVEAGDPFIEFYAAVTRRDLDGYAGDGWHTEQAVSRDQALKMLTLWPAYAAFQETERGTVEAGKVADFTVIDRDIMTIETGRIPETEVVMTLIDGEIVYRNEVVAD